MVIMLIGVPTQEATLCALGPFLLDHIVKSCQWFGEFKFQSPESVPKS